MPAAGEACISNCIPCGQNIAGLGGGIGKKNWPYKSQANINVVHLSEQVIKLAASKREEEDIK